MSDEIKDRFVWWYEKIIPGLIAALLGLGVWVFNKRGADTETQIKEMRVALSGEIEKVQEKLSASQVQTSGLVLQIGWQADRLAEIRQNQIKLEERIRSLEQAP